ncbi:hypothetical protein GCM10011409_00160 [Lentibacillus populi]|uniref:Protein gp8 n=1 Tax=Lentibacillus populi TaxID=1827502 RepID=A0A9W5TTG1_9BACI|nr:hypothetical protein [Lentibacillus populi]GGB26809.1 hypothetical protein GCM10011409_00160 [Lentibacillus populi]
MPYLTYEEFKELIDVDIDGQQFNNLLPKASAILDNVTNHFYARCDMDKDNSWRVNKFKQALCAQIEYFHSLGATTFEEINNAPQTFSAGRTSVSNASRYNPSGANESKPLVAEDVFIYLEGTGLLFRGVGVW